MTVILYVGVKDYYMNSKMEAKQTEKPKKVQQFHPFRIFDRKVARRFVIHPRDFSKYSKQQLDEKVKYQLRLFEFDDVIWYAARDVCIFLGMYATHAQRILEHMDPNLITKKTVSIEISSKTHKNKTRMRDVEIWLLRKEGVYEMIQHSHNECTQEFKSWLSQEVVPIIYKCGMYVTDDTVDKLKKEHNSDWLNDTLCQIETYKQEIRKLEDERQKMRKTHDSYDIGYVYISSSELYMKDDIYKIGSTKDLNKRISTMNTSHDINDSLFILKAYKVAHCRHMEKLIHIALSENRNSTNREFFKMPYDSIVDVMNQLLPNIT